MELHQLEYFVAVAEEGGFTAGARRAGVVQSAVSAAVARLENEFGLDLFHRHGRQVALTDPGQALLVHARDVLGAAQIARQELERRRHGLSGTVVVGTLLSTGTLDLAGALRGFHERHPAVFIRLRHSPGHSEEHLTAVREGAADLAVVIVPDRPSDGVRVDLVGSIRPALVASPGHPLAGRPEISTAELADQSFIDFPVGYGNRENIDAHFRAAGVRRSVTVEVTDVASMLELVAGGLGLAFVPAREVVRSDEIVVLALAEPIPAAPLGIACTSRRRLSPATEALRRALLGTE